MSKQTNVKILLNIGTDDVKAHAFPRAYQRDEVVSVDERQKAILLRYGWATEKLDDEPEEAEPAVEPDEISSVADLNQTDAIDHIGRMRSKEKLQSIADTDTRPKVQNAARERIAAL